MTSQNLQTLKNSFVNQNNDVGDRWATAINRAQNNGKPVSLKKWLQNHDVVEAALSLVIGDEITNERLPGQREVDATHSTYATFNGSRLTYAGVTSLCATSETWCGYDAHLKALFVYTAL